jgi:2-dehydro-3-deoxygluconokinase
VNGVVTLGETMGLFTATSSGDLAHAADFRLGIGGAESNVAIGLARLGVPAAWIGRVGDDEVGGLVRRELRAEGVDSRVVVDPGARTGLMVKTSRTVHHTRVTYYRAGSAGSRLAPGDVDAALVAGADLLHVTGITPALSTSAAAAIDHAVAVARDAGVPVSFDVNHRSALWEAARAAPVYRALASRATVVFAGLDEAALLVAGSTVRDLAAGIADLGPAQVIVKLGAEGCAALVDGEFTILPAIPIDPVDTVGAGDAFVAGYLAEWLAGSPVTTRLDTAVRAGAFACLGEGDWESLPTRDDLATLDRIDPVSR